MKRTAWLRALCSVDRPTLLKPFAVDDWTVATDGRALLALPGANGAAEGDDGVVENVRAHLARRPPRAKARCSVADLRDWGVSEKGRPAWSPTRENSGVLAGQPVNRALVGWVLRHAPDEQVAIYANKPGWSRIYIVAESGWVLIVCPLLAEFAEGAPVFPAKALEPATT